MSIQTQVILDGHIDPHVMVRAVQQISGHTATLRSTHKRTYKLLEFVGPSGAEVIDLFLDSSVAEDYAEVVKEPSTFASIQFSPFASDVLLHLTKQFGGYFRRTDLEPWRHFAPVNTPAMAKGR
jgi:hypothetical protein